MIDLVPFSLPAAEQEAVNRLVSMHRADINGVRLADRPATAEARCALTGVVLTFTIPDWFAIVLLAMDQCITIAEMFRQGVNEPEMAESRHLLAGSVDHITEFAVSARGDDQQLWLHSDGFHVKPGLACGFLTVVGTVSRNPQFHDRAFSDLDRRVRRMVAAVPYGQQAEFEPYTVAKLGDDFLRLNEFHLRNQEGWLIL